MTLFFGLQQNGRRVIWWAQEQVVWFDLLGHFSTKSYNFIGDLEKPTWSPYGRKYMSQNGYLAIKAI